MRRVLVLINNSGIGGTERRLGRLFASMAAGEKHTVFVLNRDLWARLVAGGVISAASTGLVLLPTPFTTLGQWLGWLGRVSFWIRKIDYVLFAMWFLLRYGCARPTAFHVVLGGAYVTLPLMKLRPSHRVVVSVTDPNLEGHVGSKWARPWFFAAVRGSHCVDALTEDIRASLIAEGIDPVRITVSPGSVVDVARFVPASAKECWVVFAGRLVEEKNPGLFVAALPFIHTAVPEARFFLLGDGPLKQVLTRSIEQMGMGGLVTAEFRDDIAPVLARGLVFVSLQRKDNYPSQVLLEAMACEMATVATDVANTARLIDEDTGIRVAPEAEAVGRAVVDLLQHLDHARRLGKAARHRVLMRHSESSYRLYLDDLHRRVAAPREEPVAVGARPPSV